MRSRNVELAQSDSKGSFVPVATDEEHANTAPLSTPTPQVEQTYCGGRCTASALRAVTAAVLSAAFLLYGICEIEVYIDLTSGCSRDLSRHFFVTSFVEALVCVWAILSFWRLGLSLSAPSGFAPAAALHDAAAAAGGNLPCRFVARACSLSVRRALLGLTTLIAAVEVGWLTRNGVLAAGSCTTAEDVRIALGDGRPAAPADAVNVVLVMVDDLRYDGPYMADAPAMRSILGAASGGGGGVPSAEEVRAGGELHAFDQAHTAYPLCNPSRTATLTGTLPRRSGVTHNSVVGRERDWLDKVERGESARVERERARARARARASRRLLFL